MRSWPRWAPWLSLLTTPLVVALTAQTPEPTGPFAEARVAHVGVIVRDVDRAAATYGELFQVKAPVPAEFKGIAFPPGFSGDPDAHPKVSTLPLTGASMELLQAIGGASPWRAHLDKYGESMHHISLLVKDIPAAVEHLRSLGGRVELGGAPGLAYAYVNFRAELGFTIELNQLRPAASAPSTSAAQPPDTLGASPIRHIGMFVPNVDKTAALFAKILGVPVPAARPPSKIVFPPDFTGDRDAHNKNITFPMNVNIEFAEPVGGKSMWRDEVEARGASMHHLGIGVAPTMKAWIDVLATKGGKLVTGPGTGYAFMDMRPAYGFAIELNGK